MPDTVPDSAASDVRARFGIPGLDAILTGGLPASRLYLLEGEPGTGKTTVALQFLIEGRRIGDKGLYVTLSETREELLATAVSHGWSLDGIDIVELSSMADKIADEAYTLFHPSEVELQHTVETVLSEIDKRQPKRVVFDSLSELRMLARDPLRFRRQILALKQFFVGRESTVMLLDDKSGQTGDLQLQSIAHGVILLERLAMEYGSERRRLQVMKLRGSRFRGGYHDFRILTGEVCVYPRILRTGIDKRQPERLFESGSSGLDTLLGGGLLSGTSTLIMGSAGTGKSVLTMQYATAAAHAGVKTRVYLFDERLQTALIRAEALELSAADVIADGTLVLKQIEPTEMSPGEFAQEIVHAVEHENIGFIVIDSINGYMQSMPAERLLLVQIHELLSYLAERNVAMLMTLVQHGVFGGEGHDAAQISYLADTVLLLRYFEHQGAVRRAISVVKKRVGSHETTIREAAVGPGGLRVGSPLQDFRGVLTGIPEYLGHVSPPLIDNEDAVDGKIVRG